MTTSGSTDFTQTRNEIITRALEIFGGVGEGESPTASQLSKASVVLNSMVKNWQTQGIRLWTVDLKTKTFSASSEVTGSDGKNYTCIKGHTSAGSNKPVTGADWTTYWIERGAAGSAWVTATAYSSTGDFAAASDTIGIEKAFIRNGSTDQDIEIISRFKYMNISNKGVSGVPAVLLFDEKLSPRIYLWPILDVDDTSYVLHYSRIRRLEDFDAGSNTPDFPVKWIEPLVFGLAYKLSFGYGIPIAERQSIKNEFKELLAVAKADDSEKTEREFVKSSY